MAPLRPRAAAASAAPEGEDTPAPAIRFRSCAPRRASAAAPPRRGGSALRHRASAPPPAPSPRAARRCRPNAKPPGNPTRGASHARPGRRRPGRSPIRCGHSGRPADRRRPRPPRRARARPRHWATMSTRRRRACRRSEPQRPLSAQRGKLPVPTFAPRSSHPGGRRTFPDHGQCRRGRGGACLHGCQPRIGRGLVREQPGFVIVAAANAGLGLRQLVARRGEFGRRPGGRVGCLRVGNGGACGGELRGRRLDERAGSQRKRRGKLRLLRRGRALSRNGLVAARLINRMERLAVPCAGG